MTVKSSKLRDRSSEGCSISKFMLGCRARTRSVWKTISASLRREIRARMYWSASLPVEIHLVWCQSKRNFFSSMNLFIIVIASWYGKTWKYGIKWNDINTKRNRQTYGTGRTLIYGFVLCVYINIKFICSEFGHSISPTVEFLSPSFHALLIFLFIVVHSFELLDILATSYMTIVRKAY